MTIYLDDDFKCHIENDDTMREVETDFFDGKCKEFIEGYRFIPNGETWIREDGEIFKGEMISPWVDYSILERAQRAYEEGQAKVDNYLTQIETALGLIDDDY